MHDIDRALFESEQYESDEYTGENEWLGESEGELYESPYGESGGYESGSYESGDRESELATELLEITTEQELDRFLGNLIGSAVSGVRNFARSKAGRAVGGVLKGAAKQALPGLGRALGDTFGVGDLGQQAGTWLSGQFESGLQTEGLSAEDRQFETARAFVRFADDTAQRAARAGGDPTAAAKQAATAAARKHLPGLVQGGQPGRPGPRRSGRWVRRDNRIILLGV
jgi:hypothetical protein